LGCSGAVKYAPAIRKDGSIVLTTGVAGRRPAQGMDSGRKRLRNYRSLTRALAVELAPIRVNAVSLASFERTSGKA